MRFAMSANMFCCAAAKSVPVRPHICASACIYSNGVTSEPHHLPNGFAFVEPVKPEIDLFQLEPAAH